MQKRIHKVNFLIEEDVWKEFSKKCIDEGKTRTEVIKELIKKFIG